MTLSGHSGGQQLDNDSQSVSASDEDSDAFGAVRHQPNSRIAPFSPIRIGKTEKTPVFPAISIDVIQNCTLDLSVFGFGPHPPDIERTIPKGVLK